jgi:CHAT domain-containing protein
MRLIRVSLRNLIILGIALTLLGQMLDKAGPWLADSAACASRNNQQNSSAHGLPKQGEWAALELVPGESHYYSFSLKAEDYIQLVFEQQGVNIEVTINGPFGSMSVNSFFTDYQPIRLSWIARAAGEYRVEMRSLEKGHARGRYGLKVQTIRPSIAADKPRIIAEQLVTSGVKLLKEWREESMRAALAKFISSLVSWKEAGDPRGEADALKRMGEVYKSLGEFEKARSAFQDSLAVTNGLGDRESQVRILNALCWTYLLLGNNQKALEYAEHALNISKATRDRWGEAESLNNLGEVYSWLGQVQRAVELYDQAQPIWTTLGDRRGTAQTYMYLGFTYSDLGEPTKAFEFFEKALPLWESQNDPIGAGNAIAAIARLYSRIGESQLALDHFNKARALMKGIGDPISDARVLSGIAYVYDGLGNQSRALEYYDKALQLYRGTKYLNGVKVTLFDMGSLYHALGDYQKALDCYTEDLALSETVGDSREQAFALRGIGLVHNSLGHKTAALDFLRKALTFYRAEKDLRGEADTLNLIGSAHEGTAQANRAIKYYQQALPIHQRAADRVGEASSLYNIARAERSANHLPEARAKIESALSIIESLRSKVASEDSRSSYFASIRQYYELHVDILMSLAKNRPQQGFEEAAFNSSENARARSFLESIKEAHIDIRTGVNPSLIERERSLQQQLNEKAEQYARGNTSEAETISKKIGELTVEYNEVKTEIKTQNPQYAELSQQRPLNLAELQQRILDDHTTLLEYMLGAERSYVWAVSRTEMWSSELPARDEIEKQARGVYSLVVANQALPGEAFQQTQERMAKASKQLPVEIHNLSQLLLGPIASKLATKRLLIVPDGALQYVPFQILTAPVQQAAARFETGVTTSRPLVWDHEIVNEPSASALALVVSLTRDRRPRTNNVAVLADPVFEVDDPRVASAVQRTGVSMTAQVQETELRRAVRDVNLTVAGNHIPRLLASRSEAKAIMSVAPWRSGFEAIGFDASRATAMKSDLGNYRIVHFATHGLLNNEHPELSGIVLSLFDEKGQPQDGFLRLHDIYNLKLPVDLVVLSACNTALGKDVRGEGLIGLTRGFMYAGASSVVASLWKVDDEATAELMRLFYGYMLQDGLSPAAALRKAQVSMSQQERWQSPYYWAGFILQGEYLSKGNTGHTPMKHLVLWLLGAAVVTAAGLYALKRRRKIAF